MMLIGGQRGLPMIINLVNTEQAAKTLWQLFQKALAAHTPPNTCLSVEETPTDVFTVKILTPDDELNFVKMQGYEQKGAPI